MSGEGKCLTEEVSQDQILSIMQDLFGKQTEIADCSPILGGHYNQLFDITVKNPARHVVLRVAPGDDRPLRRYEQTMMLAEPYVYNYIRQAGVPTIDILKVDGSRSIIDRDYIVMDYIDAVQMNHPSVPEEVHPRIMQDVGRYTAMIHGVTEEKFGWVMPDGSIRGSKSWTEVFGELMVETYDNCKNAEIITADEAAAALDCYHKYRAAFDECKVPALIHNDIWAPNIMVKEIDGEWQIVAIIDADRALFADREFEFVLYDNPNPDFMLGYGIPPDTSENAMIRKKFYRMQLYMQYSWFYLVMTPSPSFQPVARKIAMDTLQELLDL
ncbi:MAG TPA: aminoglycoside phosphotransferase family protein [Armatimonadota bacterium]|nr:aminoglycoside phosphotransferase family protein [Armatimonadota bacterium]HPP74974.1 aminoglycoside phosphotransferase family protein [Armatimonadota bacterium]